MKKIAFGCDHVGFILKHEIVAHLVERGAVSYTHLTLPTTERV